MTKKYKFLVIDCGRNGLGIIRSLGEKNISCIAVDFSDKPAFKSKYVSDYYKLNREDKYSYKLIEELIKIAKIHADYKIILLPVNDVFVELFAKHYQILAEYFILGFISDLDKIDLITDKTKMADLSDTIGVLTPERYKEIDVKNNSVSYPVIIKPVNRTSLDILSQDIAVFRARVCNNDQELTKNINILKDSGVEFIIQRLISGADDTLYTAGVVAVNGRLCACFTGRKIRQFPPEVGEASFAQSEPIPELVEFSKKIVKATNFTGISQIEFKKENNKYYLLEMNPRSWSWNRLASHSGVNLPFILFKNLINPDAENKVILNSREEKWSYFFEDFLHNFIINKNISFFKLIKQSYRAKSFAYFDKKDIKPWIKYYILDGFILLKHFIKMSLTKN